VTAQSGGGQALTPEQQAARRAFQNSPELKAYRGFIGCAYVTILSNDDAKAKGVVLDGGRPGLMYIPGTGITFVQARELPQGGGSLKSGATPVPTGAGASAPATAPSPAAAPSPAVSPAPAPQPTRR
jgi:hypothetical protein